MKLKTIKNEAEVRDAALALAGLDGTRPYIAATERDGTITEVRVGLLVITSDYGMKVSRQIEHEEVEKWRVRVDHPAFPTLNRYFDTEFEGRQFKRPYEAIDGAVIDEKKVTVQVDDSGKVLAELNDEGTAMPLAPQGDDNFDQIPF